jgi:hypothetical protein
VSQSVSITIQDWRLVPQTTREQLWSNVKTKIKFLDGVDEEFMNSATFICMGRLFYKWKLDLNRKYVKKQLIPKHMDKIT